MKNDSRWSAKQELRGWEKKYLARLQSLLEQLIIKEKEELQVFAASPETRVPKIRIAAGKVQALTELHNLTQGVLNEK